MNDLEDVASHSDHAVRTTLHGKGHISPENDKPLDHRATSREKTQENNNMPMNRISNPRRTSSQKKPQHKYNQADAEDPSLYQSTLWWFASTAFPLFAGTFGPIANLFSVCALVQPWRVGIYDEERIDDPPWLTSLNACSLFFALCANITLLFNFARRIPYAIAQPVTITLWYCSSILLAVPIALTHKSHLDSHLEINTMVLSQSYYYALISCSIYFSVSSLLLVSTLGSTVFHAYPPSFSSLTTSQRTLMLQTISFSLYLSLGAGVFSSIEDWRFTDGVYWADYTLLTIGLGTDFPLTTTLARMLLIPYAAFGITLIGLVVSSVRGLVLERAKAKVVRRHLGKERRRWKENIIERQRLHTASLHTESTTPTADDSSHTSKAQRWSESMKERRLMKLPRKLEKYSSRALKQEDQQGKWHRAEFDLMRFIETSSENAERYTALTVSFVAILVVWFGGSVVFWVCEHKSQGWTYPESIYFTYTTLLTIGYGDFYPNSPAGKPFFVVWSLISVPAMTVLISNMGDTVVQWVKNMTVWVSEWTILPERILEQTEKDKEKGEKRRHHKHGRGSKDKSRQHSRSGGEEAAKHDVEHLGGKDEKSEEGEGGVGSLAARLAREISHLAKDLRKTPPKKYPWQEWVRWLDMLGERERDLPSGQPQTAIPIIHPIHEPWHETHSDPNLATQSAVEDAPDVSPRLQSTSIPVSQHHATAESAGSERAGASHLELPNWRGPWMLHPIPSGPTGIVHDDSRSGNGDSEDDADWRWTWLDDHGPLFSRLTETEWIIEKLCFRLEEVLEDEIREARASASASASGKKS